MSDLERFMAFFDSMGVVYDAWRDSEDDGDTGVDVLTCGQGHFHFGLTDGAFIGVKSDEMGNWYPRRVVPAPAPEVTCGTCGHWGGDPESLSEAWCRILRRLTRVDCHACRRDHYTPRGAGGER